AKPPMPAPMMAMRSGRWEASVIGVARSLERPRRALPHATIQCAMALQGRARSFSLRKHHLIPRPRPLLSGTGLAVPHFRARRWPAITIGAARLSAPGETENDEHQS